MQDVFNRYLRRLQSFFYVFTKACVVLFAYSPDGHPIAIMNVTLRSMKLILEKYDVQCKIVFKDKTEMALQYTDTNSIPAGNSQPLGDDWQGCSSQIVFESQW